MLEIERDCVWGGFLGVGVVELGHLVGERHCFSLVSFLLFLRSEENVYKSLPNF